jgi:hypothetical protein
MKNVKRRRRAAPSFAASQALLSFARPFLDLVDADDDSDGVATEIALRIAAAIWNDAPHRAGDVAALIGALEPPALQEAARELLRARLHEYAAFDGELTDVSVSVHDRELRVVASEVV